MTFSATLYYRLWTDAEGVTHSQVLDPFEIFVGEPPCEHIPTRGKGKLAQRRCNQERDHASWTAPAPAS